MPREGGERGGGCIEDRAAAPAGADEEPVCGSRTGNGHGVTGHLPAGTPPHR